MLHRASLLALLLAACGGNPSIESEGPDLGSCSNGRDDDEDGRADCDDSGCAAVCGTGDGGTTPECSGTDECPEGYVCSSITRRCEMSSALCSETCEYTGDGECDDGGEGALTSACELGTDCIDCGPRSPSSCVALGASCTSAPCCDGECVDGTCTASCGADGDGCSGASDCCSGTCTAGTCGTATTYRENDACTCSAPYNTCTSTSGPDGCGGSIPLLSCYAESGGNGFCRYGCASEDDGTQGRCPSGYVCQISGGPPDALGEPRAVCVEL